MVPTHQKQKEKLFPKNREDNTCQKGVSEGWVSRNKTIDSTFVKMCQKGVPVSCGGVNIKDPVPLDVMDYEWSVSFPVCFFLFKDTLKLSTQVFT